MAFCGGPGRGSCWMGGPVGGGMGSTVDVIMGGVPKGTKCGCGGGACMRFAIHCSTAFNASCKACCCIVTCCRWARVA